jgi:WS/DGAT/MGAT family acyltransferase
VSRYAYDRLTVLDNSFLAFEGANTPMHVATTMVYDAGPLRTPEGGIDIDEIRAYVTSRLHKIPRYRQRLAWIPIDNHPVWIDDEYFNIHYHVRHTSLPRPGDDRQLKRLSARIMAQRLDRDRPLWELWIVEGLAGDRFAAVSKTHHCMIDGVSGVDLLSVLMTPEPTNEVGKAPPYVARAAPTSAELLWDEVARRSRMPFDLLRGAGTVLRELQDAGSELQDRLRALANAAGASWLNASDTPFNAPIGPHRRFDWLEMSIPEIKEIRAQLGGSLNDVVLACVTGAVRRFLAQRHVDPRGIDFRVMAPVSTRTAEERGTLGNRVSAWNVPLPVGEADPRARLAKLAETTQRLKESKQALAADVLARVSEWTPSTLLSLGAQLVSARIRPFNMVVTNVPGPQVPLYMLRARMLACYPMVPLWMNQGVGIALFSYAGTLYWGFNAEWQQFPDLHEFALAIAESFAELREAAASSATGGNAREKPSGRPRPRSTSPARAS